MKKEKRNKSWKGILLIVLLLAIGFAAVTTTLVINGTINFGANPDNFEENLIFTDAKLEYSDTTKTAVTDATTLIIANAAGKAGKKISFTIDPLTMINETATLTYEITNSSQYDAALEDLVCTVKNAADQDVTAAVVTNKTGDYIKLEHSSLADKTIAKGGKLSDQTITVTMIKSYVGTETENETSYTVDCSIVANAQSAS